MLPPALADDARLAATRALVAVATIRDAGEALDRAGVQWLLWKGPALAVLAWNDFVLRHFSDLDLVVSPADRDRAAQALLGAGWRPRGGMSIAQQRSINAGTGAFDLERNEGEPFLELHWRFAARRFPSVLSVGDVMRRAEVVDIAGRSVRTPSGADALRLQALHSTKHGWSQAEEVVVFARLVERWPDAARALRAESAGDGGAGPLSLAFALLELLTADAPARPHSLLASSADACLSRMRVGDAAWRPDHAWALRWIPRPLDRARYWLHALLDPTAEEWKWVHLPASLCWAYPAVRVVRLAVRRPPSAV